MYGSTLLAARLDSRSYTSAPGGKVSEGSDSKVTSGEDVESSAGGKVLFGVCNSAGDGEEFDISGGLGTVSDVEEPHERGFQYDLCLIVEGIVAVTSCEGKRGLLVNGTEENYEGSVYCH
jgi:hypothetical protein